MLMEEFASRILNTVCLTLCLTHPEHTRRRYCFSPFSFAKYSKSLLHSQHFLLVLHSFIVIVSYFLWISFINPLFIVGIKCFICVLLDQLPYPIRILSPKVLFHFIKELIHTFPTITTLTKLHPLQQKCIPRLIFSRSIIYTSNFCVVEVGKCCHCNVTQHKNHVTLNSVEIQGFTLQSYYQYLYIQSCNN